jgi:hypothetical protein
MLACIKGGLTVEYWAKQRTYRFSTETPPESWPKGVRPISTNGLSLLGVHESSGLLFWDGREIVTRFSFGWLPLTIAGIAAAGTFGQFILKIGEIRGWW